MPDIHSAIIEGLNKFVEMIVAPINARLDALEQKNTEVPSSYTPEQINALINERFQQLQDQQMGRLRDYVHDSINTKFDDDLGDAVRETINGFNISAEITVRR